MPSTQFRPKVFVSYSHRDRDLKEKFDDNLQVLKEQGIIDFWTDGEIQAGDHWPDEIANAMNEANLILFLVSNHFLASSFIRNKEAPMAMVRQNKGQAVIVPIILRKTPGWQKEEWNTLQALPSQVKPVDHPDWRCAENAFAEVEERLRELIEDLPQKLAKQSSQWRSVSQGHEVKAASASTGDFRASKSINSSRHLSLGWLEWVGLAAAFVLSISAMVYFESPVISAKKIVPKQSESDVSPELKAWIDAPQVDRSVMVIYGPKGNGMFQNGFQQLTGSSVTVAARRIHELIWEEPEGILRKQSNGAQWEVVMRDLAGNPIKEEVKLSVYFNALKTVPGLNKSGQIYVDPSDKAGYAECGTEDCPPGFNCVSYLTGVPSPLWDPKDVFLSPLFYAGAKGVVPEGRHRIALEAKIKDRPVYRCLFYILVPPMVYSKDQNDWVTELPKSEIEVSIVDQSVCWPSEGEINWKMQIKCDPSRLKDPLSFLHYFRARERDEPVSNGWTVDNRRDLRIGRAVEIEGFNRYIFTWGGGWGGIPEFKSGVAKQLLTIVSGPRGKLAGGRYPIAIEMLSRGDPVWRGIVHIDVPAKPWSLPDAENLLEITTADDQDIRTAVNPIAAVKADRHVEKGLSVGLTFGPLKVKNKGQALTGPFLVQYYLKAVRAPKSPTGFATISAGPYPGITILDKPDEGGFTARAASSLILENQVGTKGQFDTPIFTFYVGEDKTQPGEIPVGVHEIGIEILQQTGSGWSAPIYRGTTKLELR